MIEFLSDKCLELLQLVAMRTSRVVWLDFNQIYAARFQPGGKISVRDASVVNENVFRRRRSNFQQTIQPDIALRGEDWIPVKDAGIRYRPLSRLLQSFGCGSFRRYSNSQSSYFSPARVGAAFLLQ